MSLLSETPTVPLGEQLGEASAASPSLVADVVRNACRRLPFQAQSDKAARIEQLVRLGAWTDAALALVELALPQWQVRRLAYDDGQWYCVLSRTRELPDWLDQSVEGRHADLALAILGALVEVQRIRSHASRTSVPAGRPGSSSFEPVCCDSFS
jgi:hypothetical protein